MRECYQKWSSHSVLGICEFELNLRVCLQASRFNGMCTLNMNTDHPWGYKGVTVFRKQTARQLSVAPVRYGTCEGAGSREGFVAQGDT